MEVRKSTIGIVSSIAFFAMVLSVIPNLAHAADGASLLFSPATGAFTVGSTFNVSVLVNTGGKSVNAVRADITFPASRLQVVNPSAGTSFVSIWVSQPTYSNTAGTISFQGGLPNPGIKTDAGVMSTITFRVTAPGTAKLAFTGTSQVLANDGQGTNILNSKGDANFTLNLAAPEGPVLSSPSHPDQNTWYQNRTVDYNWDEVPNAVGYSYVFDQNPRTTPQERQDATPARSTSVTADRDGRWYFHLRAKVTSWGGTSHGAVLIDGTPPAAFTPTVDPATPEPGKRPELKFLTTDAMSGIDHYEMQLLALDDPNQATPFFTEVVSPVRLPELTAGRYQVLVRAFDQAGNSTDGKLDFTVAAPPSGSIIGRTPLLQNTLFTNVALIGAGLLVLILATWLVVRWRRRAGDVIHDIHKLEQETLRKESELVRTIQAAHSLEASIEQQFAHQQEAQELQRSLQSRVGQQPPQQPPQNPGQPTDFLHPSASSNDDFGRTSPPAGQQ